MKSIYTHLKNLHIVYVDDQQENLLDISSLLKNYFKKVTTFDNPKDFLAFYEKKNSFDILLCDIQMPQINGLDLIDIIRKENPLISIIILTAHSTNDYLMKSVNKNIQYYIVKPINFTKLQEALHSSINYINLINNKEEAHTSILGFNYLSSSGILENDEEKIFLNSKEREILNLLLSNKNHAVSYEEIENKVWTANSEYMTENALRTVVKTLRKKLKDTKSIKNISKIGYIYNEEH